MNYLKIWWAHGGVERKGRWGTYPLHVVFTKVVSPPWSVLVYREGLRGRETGFIPHQQHQTGAEPLNLKRHARKQLVLLLSRCIAGPSSDPGQDWIQTSPSNSLSPVCLLFGTERWADIQAPQAAPKEGSLDLQTLTILDRGILVIQEE